MIATTYRKASTLGLLGGVTAVIVIAASFIGMQALTPWSITAGSIDYEIFWRMRVPRILAAFLAGSGLALCGMVFQAIFRNPMADPFTLGTASGASCGAAATVLAGFTGAVLGIPLVSVGAFIGAAIAMAVVSIIASARRTTGSLTMLLTGIAVSFLFSSLLMFIQYVSNFRDSFQIVRWLMGGLQATSYGALITLFAFWCVGVALISVQLPRLDQLLAGEDLAHSRGVNVVFVRQWLLAAATLLIAGIVAVCGPIGFVGLMVPHICRRLISANHLLLGPACVLVGGSFLVIADTVSRIIIAPAEMPVGVLTALIGGPFFLWLLFGKRKNDEEF
jgi:iron complex transport system permease protein